MHDAPAKPTFEEMPAASPLDEPLTDISAGWDGTLWAITKSGVPHRFSRQDNAWYVHGRGIDAIAWDATGSATVFRGTQCSRDGEEPMAIASLWPSLSPTFQTGVDAAAIVDGVLYLFKAGRYTRAGLSREAVVNETVELASLTGWPHTDTWTHGLVDAVGASLDGKSATITLFRDDEFLVVDLEAGAVAEPPAKLNTQYSGDLLEIMLHGIDAVEFDGGTTTVYQGPLTWESANGGTPRAAYLDLRPEWNPTLDHAPAGRADDLWSIDPSGNVYRHDGDDWSHVAGPTTTPTSITAGADAVVHAITKDNQIVRRDEQTQGWSSLVTASTPLAQITAGDVEHVYALAEDGHMHRFDPATKKLAPVAKGFTATHVAAASDGTVWHCNADPNAVPKVYRHLSASSASPTPLDVATATQVQKVATTGFGRSHVLALADGAPRLFALTSSVVMKTPGSYDSAMGRQMAVGAGCIFLPFYDNAGTEAYHGCIDAHTGQERWRIRLSKAELSSMTESVFDPVFQLLYVVLDNRMTAVDVQTGNIVWRYDEDHGPIVARPTLRGTVLVAVTDTGTVMAFDTVEAHLMAADKQPASVTPQWTWSPLAAKRAPWTPWAAPQPPLIMDDGVVISVWHRTIVDSRPHIHPQVLKLHLDASLTAPERFYWSAEPPYGVVEDYVHIEQMMRLVPPVPFAASSFRAGPGMEVRDTIIVGWHRYIFQFDTAGNPIGTGPYELMGPDHKTADDQITSGLTLHRETGVDESNPEHPLPYSVPICVFGTAKGMLHAVQLGPESPVKAWRTPHDTQQRGMITTTPFVLPRAGTTPVIHFGVGGSNQLWAFDTADPSKSDPIETGATAISTIVPTSNNVVFAGGSFTGVNADDTSIAQCFALRVDDSILNDFIVESQLLEDRSDKKVGDKEPGDQLTRYQTHVTIVGTNKVARPSQQVKVWVDGPTPVALEVDGEAYPNIDASTPAVFHTDATGSFTITATDEADDTTAVPLRLWAEFMDQHERIVIYPDHELHERLATPIADSSVDDVHDPTTIDLSTAQNFHGDNLCTTEQATSTAKATHRTWNAVHHDAGNTSAAPHAFAPHQGVTGERPPRGRRSRTSRSGRRTGSRERDPVAATMSKYVAYPGGDGGVPPTTGMAYFAEDVQAYRPATVITPTGFQLDDTDTFAELSVARAAATIDELEGTDVTFDLLTTDQPVAGFFKDLWHLVKRLGNDIKKVVVHIGNDVIIGLQYVEKEAEKEINKVIRAVVSTVEDIASLVGTFFVKLGKLIGDIVEALTVLFNFPKIIATAEMIKAKLSDATAAVANKDQLTNAVDTAFGAIEGSIDTTLNDLIEHLKGEGIGSAAGTTIGDKVTPIATAHSAFSVAPQGSTNTKSHAVQSCWASHKLRTNLKHASAPKDSDAGAAGEEWATLIPDLIAGFVNDPKDPTLQKDLNDAKAVLHTKFKIHSADDLLKVAAADLLEIIKLILDIVLEAIRKLIDKLISIFPEAVDDLGGIEIPVLSAVYSLFNHGKKLTVMDLVAFVLAIPVAILYRIVWGTWPTDADAELQTSTLSKAFLTAGGVAMVFAGLITAVLDLAFILELDVPFGTKVAWKIAATIMFIGLIANAALSEYNLAHAGLHVRYDFSEVALAITFAIFSLIFANVFVKPKQGMDKLLSVLRACLAIVQAAFVTAAWADKDGKFSSKALVSAVASYCLEIPTIVNPLKYLPDDSLVPAVVPTLDIVFRPGAGVIMLIEAWAHDT